jgi:acyl-CoA reductase-like NAD-dependent aldehyde dehydrogenase
LPVSINTTGRSRLLGAGVKVREPIGVVAAITPYNFPFSVNMGKITQALAAGCSIVLKPSPYTPLEALILGEIAQEAGLPPGVLNIITGDADVGGKLTTDPRVDMVTFTGSDKVGAAIQAQAAPTLKRCVMELGGKSALIVRHDADIRMSAVIGSAFTVHSGQGCALTTRHLIHNSVRREYVAALKAQVEKMVIGNPADPKVTIGPLIREVARKRTEEYVGIARDEGATLVAGGKRPEHLERGFFYLPTIFDDVLNSHRLAREEVFGPVAAVIGFDDDDEAVAMANDSDFGLSGAIQSADVPTAYEMALRIRTGSLTINGGTGAPMESSYPFGGIKRSGYGRENGIEGIDEFTYIKTVGFHAA